MARIKGTDTPMDVVVKMVDGNPGATSVCMRLIQEGNAIDPGSSLGGLNIILMLDTFEVYGSRIWMLYKDVCGEDIVKTTAVIRAHQLGIITRAALNHAIDNYGRGIDVDELLVKVKEALPAFGKGE